MVDRKKAGKKARSNGARLERDVARLWMQHFSLDKTQVFRGAPVQAQGGEPLPDVVVPQPLHIECGANSAANPVKKLEQADRAVLHLFTKGSPNATPVAVCRAGRKPITATFYARDLFPGSDTGGQVPLTCSLTDFMSLIEEIHG